MVTLMNDQELTSLEQVRAFLEGAEAVVFSIQGKEASYAWIERTLFRFHYRRLGRADKGLIIRYLMKVSGYSRQQITRLIQQYQARGIVKRRQRTANGFQRRYTGADVRRLAEVDALHGTLSGPVTKKLLERASELFGQPHYRRLAGISVSHLYNLRHSTAYARQRLSVHKTRSRACAIGERRKPRPDQQPGFLRIDTVHQGDRDGIKGLYHINAVDEVTQFEVVATTERISEHYLLPVLELQLQSFPFRLQGFHSDNGSEFINRTVAKLLHKLLIAFTKSRARHSNDNALAESKNGSVVRKHLGYAHIPQHCAPPVNAFLQQHLNPYLNFHRPCFFSLTVQDANGKQRKTYPYDRIMTPYEKLKSLPNAPRYLKAGISFEDLDAIAYAISDNEAARQLNDARRLLFKTISEQDQGAA